MGFRSNKAICDTDTRIVMEGTIPEENAVESLMKQLQDATDRLEAEERTLSALRVQEVRGEMFELSQLCAFRPGCEGRGSFCRGTASS